MTATTVETVAAWQATMDHGNALAESGMDPDEIFGVLFPHIVGDEDIRGAVEALALGFCESNLTLPVALGMLDPQQTLGAVAGGMAVAVGLGYMLGAAASDVDVPDTIPEGWE